MSEAVAMSKSSNIIRRLSNRATQFAGRRRQSSTTAMSRDLSNGPVTMRRRSDSTNTAPEGGRGALFSDSDDDLNEDSPYDLLGVPAAYSVYGLDTNRDFPSTTASMSSTITPGASPGPGPVVPHRLLQGTNLTKLS